VDVLARLRLRTGARLVAAPREMWELLDLCGLAGALADAEGRRRVAGLRDPDEGPALELPE